MEVSARSVKMEGEMGKDDARRGEGRNGDYTLQTSGLK